MDDTKGIVIILIIIVLSLGVFSVLSAIRDISNTQTIQEQLSGMQTSLETQIADLCGNASFNSNNK